MFSASRLYAIVQLLYAPLINEALLAPHQLITLLKLIATQQQLGHYFEYNV